MIRREDLERFLEKDYSLGFTIIPDDPNRLGWILLHKEKVGWRYLSLLEPGEDDFYVREQKEIDEKPYVVQIIELERTKHESESYMEEYDVQEVYRFSGLDTAQVFLDKYGKKLEEIKWRIEIDAP